MTAPVRLQLSRAKGFNLQAHSRAVNGLAVINCARPGRWGNPFRARGTGTAEDCVNAYRAWLAIVISESADLLGADMAELRGKNLACFCKLGEACHVDVLLELANR